MVIQLVCLWISFVLSPSKLSAQSLPVVPVGIAGLNNNTIHSYVSRDTGLFRKYGIDARLVVFQAGSLLAQASMAGEVKISMVAGPVTIASRAAGSDSIIIGALINTLPYKMIVAKGITRSDQLKGKKIGISRFGSSTDTAVRLFLAKFALNADKDVVLVQAGEQANRFAALAAGTIDATIVGVPISRHKNRDSRCWPISRSSRFPILKRLWKPPTVSFGKSRNSSRIISRDSSLEYITE